MSKIAVLQLKLYVNPIQPERGLRDPGRVQRPVKKLSFNIHKIPSVTFSEILSSFVSGKQKSIILNGF